MATKLPKRPVGRPHMAGGIERVHLSLRRSAAEALLAYAEREGLHISQAASRLIEAGARELAR